jgi:hypothetical protein
MTQGMGTTRAQRTSGGKDTEIVDYILSCRPYTRNIVNTDIQDPDLLKAANGPPPLVGLGSVLLLVQGHEIDSRGFQSAHWQKSSARQGLASMTTVQMWHVNKDNQSFVFPEFMSVRAS